MNKAKLRKQVPEGVRERETFKYDPSLLTTAKFIKADEPIATAGLTSSDDPILTALAQLGAWRTGTDRSFISLFDSQHQYIVAEATPSQPLDSLLPSDRCRQRLWLCGTALPRSHGVCDLTLVGDSSTLKTSKNEDEGKDKTQLSITLSQDLTTDVRFSSKPYCQLGGSARFYAAVPIQTPRGINIGVYCVVSLEPGKEWTDDDTDRLREISQSIMVHLELRRSTDLCRRNERMNRGLGSFIEGKSTMSGWKYGPHAAAFMDRPDHEGALNRKQQYLQRNDECTETSTTGVDSDPCPHQIIPQSNKSDIGVKGPQATSKDMGPLLDAETPTGIFSKAANIIRESIEVEGCLFFDATMGSYRSPSMINRTNDMQNQSSSTSSSDESIGFSKPSTASCQLLGFSTSEGSSVDGAASKRPGASIAEKFLAKLLRRHPKGKIFNFSADGELQPSDFSEDDRTISPSSIIVNDPSFQKHELEFLFQRSPKKSGSLQNEGSILLNAFSGARSVAFVPIWDPKKERWYAGGFIYTKNPARTLTLQGELSYLRAFGTLAIADILRFNTLISDRAKSDALGSLSHELRSPLHGVLLSAELLMDTDLDVFQGNATHTIETCSRTLLDTIDHLLDYAKINHFKRRDSSLLSGDKHQMPRQGAADWKHFGGKTLICPSRLDGLTEEVVESVFAGFNFQHSSAQQLAQRRSSVANSDISTSSRKLTDDEGPQQTFQDVLILLSFDPRCNWTYNLPVGALRRIIMNIFGNSLKYTRQGKIEVSLNQDVVVIKGKKKQRVVKITVQDTGKGISPEYLKQRLFRPFSQEDELAPGTGLGLSLVKQIVSQLGGHISVESRIGLGTTVSIVLPLEKIQGSSDPVLTPSDDDKEFEERCNDLKGLRIQIIFPNSTHEDSSDSHKNTLQSTCTDWLHMEVISDAQADLLRPDLTLWSYDALPTGFQDIIKLADTPNLVICSNPLEAYRQSQSFESAGHAGIFEFLSQPVGPRKLAKTLVHVYKRWMNRPIPLTTPPLLIKPLNDNNSWPNLHAAPHLEKWHLEQVSSSTQTESTTSRRCNDISTPPHEDKVPALHPSDGSPSNQTPSSSSSGNGPSQTPQSSTPLKLLLVDDNKINLKVLSTYVNKLGLQYETATNGKEAVDYFMESPQEYKCILMDISMPVMDGFEATRCIRAYESLKELTPTSIVALSGLASEDAQREASGSGMDSFLTKPVKLKVLEGLLNSHGLLN